MSQSLIVVNMQNQALVLQTCFSSKYPSRSCLVTRKQQLFHNLSFNFSFVITEQTLPGIFRFPFLLSFPILFFYDFDFVLINILCRHTVTSDLLFM